MCMSVATVLVWIECIRRAQLSAPSDTQGHEAGTGVYEHLYGRCSHIPPAVQDKGVAAALYLTYKEEPLECHRAVKAIGAERICIQLNGGSSRVSSGVHGHGACTVLCSH